MKIKNTDEKINIEKIFIQQLDNRIIVTLLINNQVIEMIVPAFYMKHVFDYIEQYLQTLGGNNYVRI